MIIAHNIAAMNAQRKYGIMNTKKAKSMEKLSNGYRINRAADDAAGLKISEKMRSLARGLNRGAYNIQDGISLIQVADSALAEVNDMLHRMTELTVQAANGTNSDGDRQAIQQEINELIKEIDRVGKTTEFNKMPILDDAFGVEDPTSIKQFVTSGSADSGYFKEAYLDSGTGKYFPAAQLDFSNINADNVENLYGNGFSFICGYGCGENFKFTFIDGDGTQSKRVGSSSAYEVDIHGLTTGSAIASKLVEVATNNSQYGTDVLTGVKQIAHRQGIKAEGNKIIVVDTMNTSPTPSAGYTTASAAKNVYPRAGKLDWGSIDASSITRPIQNDLVNEFNIQCSNVTNDNIVIRTKRMNANVIGIDTVNVSTQGGAESALAVIQNAGLIVSAERSALGAYQNRLEHSYDNNQNKEENITAAESRLRDTDMAKEMVELWKQNILEQVGASVITQANQSNQGVLTLLQ